MIDHPSTHEFLAADRHRQRRHGDDAVAAATAASLRVVPAPAAQLGFSLRPWTCDTWAT